MVGERLRRVRDQAVALGQKDPEIVVKLTGDVSEAAKWRRFALKKYGLLRRSAPHTLTKTITPIQGVTIRLLKQGRKGEIRIDALGGDVLYEFITSDKIDRNYRSPGFEVGGPNDSEFVTGYTMCAWPLAEMCDDGGHLDGGVDHLSADKDRMVVTSRKTPQDSPVPHLYQGAYIDQRRQFALWWDDQRRPYANFISRSRHARTPAARMARAFLAPFVLVDLTRDYGFNPPIGFNQIERLYKDGQVDLAPDLDKAIADIASRQSKVLDGYPVTIQILFNPTADYNQCACVRDNIILHIPASAKKMYAYPMTNSAPSAPTAVTIRDIPFPPEVDTHFWGLFEFNDCPQFMFRADAKKMCGVFFKHEPSMTFYRSPFDDSPMPTRSARWGNNYGLFDPVDSFDLADIGSQPVIPTDWQSFYNDPSTFTHHGITAQYHKTGKSQQLNKITPILVEWDIDLKVENGVPNVTLSIARVVNGKDVDRFFVAADYHCLTNKLVTAELECYLKDGNLFANQSQEVLDSIPSQYHDPQAIATECHYDLLMGYYNGPGAVDKKGKSLPEFEEKVRTPIFNGIVRYRYHNEYLFREREEAIIIDSQEFEDVYFLSEVHGMDLRAFAYWKEDQLVKRTQAFDEAKACLRYDYHARKRKTPPTDPRLGNNVNERCVFAYSSEQVDPKTGMAQRDATQEFFPPTSKDGTNLKKSSPHNMLTQSLMHLAWPDDIYGEFSIHPNPIWKPVALSTKVTYLLVGKQNVGEDSLLEVGVWLDFIDVGGKKTRHRDLYQKARKKDPTLPERDYDFYHENKLRKPQFTGSRTTNVHGSFRVAGHFFDDDIVPVLLSKQRRQPGM